ACEVDAGLLELAVAFAEAGKPVGLMCISPALAAKIYGPGVTCTIGYDPETAAAITKMGGSHALCAVEDIVEDEARKLV
ncbi:isoprenoid biosynthesis protein ElbB, partial [Pseudomonas syringae pv. tagetis]